MILQLDDQYLHEVFEYLCGIPFETGMGYDTEPPTSRHPGIEQLIKQIATEIEIEDIFDCDCKSCMRQQRLHIKKMNEATE